MLTVATTSCSVATLTIAPGLGALYSLQRRAVEALVEMLAFRDRRGRRAVIENSLGSKAAGVAELETKRNGETLANATMFRKDHMTVNSIET